MEHNPIDTKRRIMDAAYAIIEEQGFPALHINDLVKRSRISKKVIYDHFGSLEGLMLQLLEEQDSWTIPLPDDPVGDPAAQIKVFFHRMTEATRESIILRKFFEWELKAICNMRARRVSAQRKNRCLQALIPYAEQLQMDEKRLKDLWGMAYKLVNIPACIISHAYDEEPDMEDEPDMEEVLEEKIDLLWQNVMECLDKLLASRLPNGKEESKE